MMRAASVLVAGALAVLPVRIAAAEPEAAPAAAGEQAVVDASELGTMTDDSLTAIAEQITKMAVEKGIAPSEVKLSIVWIDRDAIEYGVRISIQTTEITITAKDNDERGPVVAKCQECTESELVTLCVEGMLEALSLYAEAQEAKEEPEAAPVEPEPKPEPEQAPVDTTKKKKIGPLGWAGVAGIAVGVSGLVAGGVLVAMDEERVDDEPTKLRDFKPPGYAALGVGGAVLVAGVVMLAIDLSRNSRKGARNKRSRAGVAPALGPEFAGGRAVFRF